MNAHHTDDSAASPAAETKVWHFKAFPGTNETGCCETKFADLGPADRMTDDPSLVTCRGRTGPVA
ncbi:hypothetical protein FHX34_104808 [Actinoplanes teichomyceticus]|uniref:Uncharacterized protein n=1 Tax=Actinoplanes teichomyceticus TaxID=1867 RepID=A0A561VSD5_ACTTI|nr:hypothetical protein FHX34_104808 [Actinoplanes teichomyceticus]GIF17249.1 hypothetical protein Ate01nite_72810 [Actinoplanes teichomyceticus]